MQRIAAIHQPECFPWLGFLDKARQSDVFILLDNVQYEKNYFHNRNKIRTSAGWSWLTIPVATKGKMTQLLSEAQIYSPANQRWREKHLATWAQNYRKSPFGERYLAGLEKIYAQGHLKIAEFNRAVILWIFEQFGIGTEVKLASELTTISGPTQRLVDLCRKVRADVFLGGISGKNYIEERLFSEAGIAVRYQEFRHPIYRQRHEPFIPCMTSLDLLFNHGPKALEILENCF